MWKRVIAPTAVVSILWIAVSGITTYQMSMLLESHSRAMSEDVTTIESAWAMRRDTWKLQVAALGAPFEDPAKARAEIAELEGTFQNSLAEAERTSLTPPEQKLVQAIREQFDSYRRQLHRQIEPVDRTNPQPPSAALREESMRLAQTVSESCRQLSDLNQRLIDGEAVQNNRLYAALIAVRIAFVLFGPMVGLLLGLWVARKLDRSISQISVTLKDVSGRLGSELGSVAVSTADDLPVLQRQVEVVAERIRLVVGELAEARRRAVQSERLAAVGELAAGVAHEIRNPLTSVKLLIQTASQRKQNPALNQQQFDVLLSEISRMELTIQGLLDFARPPTLRSVRHDVRQTLRRALTLNQARAAQQNVSFDEEMPDLPVIVDGDPDQLHSVFVNLTINAIEAMADGGKLRVAVETADGACRIHFSDTGAGIPNELLGRLFEPFVTGKERGTGLGLAISRRIIEDHGGSLFAANQPWGGAQFTVELKLTGDAVNEGRSPAPPVDPAATASVAAELEATNAKIAGY